MARTSREGCGTEPVSDARRAYDDWHRKLDAETEDVTLAPWHAAAVAHLGKLAGCSLLEIGCGRGSFARWASKQGTREATFADFSAAAVSIARRDLARDAPQARFLAADITCLPFRDETFDVVCSFETLEHVPSPDTGLAELVRVAKSGGRIIVTTPNYIGLLGAYRVFRRLTGRPYAEMGQPINQPLTLIGRVRRLKALGCHIEVADGFGHYLYLPGRTPRRMHFLDRARWMTRWFGAHSLTVAVKR